VVVVGAGLAGLTAAHELERHGRFRVTVLEARPRVGGRVHTVRMGGRHAEGGGEYVDTIHAALLGYVRRFGLKLEDAQAGPDLDDVIYLRGRRLIDADVRTAAVQAQLDRLDARSAELAAAIDAADPLRHGAAYDRLSLADLMDQLGLTGIARTLAEHAARDEYGVEPTALSLLFYLQLWAATAAVPDSGIERYRILGGNDNLAAALASGLSDLRVAQPVRRIERRRGGVRVDGIEADWCVLATPLPALRDVEFAPALPPALADAVASLQYGSISKTLIGYRERFWVRSGFTGDTLTDLPIGSLWEATNAQGAAPPGILIAYSTAVPATSVTQATAQIDRVYPGSARLATDGAIAHWPDEPYSRGCYTAYAPGQVTKFHAALRRPLGRLLLAGEHTDTFNSYMEGAIRSGRRAAAAIGRAA
jgi:monoamine oxidase